MFRHISIKRGVTSQEIALNSYISNLSIETKFRFNNNIYNYISRDYDIITTIENSIYLHQITPLIIYFIYDNKHYFISFSEGSLLGADNRPLDHTVYQKAYLLSVIRFYMTEINQSECLYGMIFYNNSSVSAADNEYILKFQSSTEHLMNGICNTQNGKAKTFTEQSLECLQLYKQSRFCENAENSHIANER